MKPHLLKIHLKSEHSFSVRYDRVPHFYNKWHYHPELELVHIIRGSGRQFIGDNVHHFKAGDMILLGANLPHLWYSDEKYLKMDSKVKLEAIVIHFVQECFGAHFFNIPENKELVRLFDRAQQAVRIKDTTKKKVSDLMQMLLLAKNSERVILLLQILQTIAHSRQTKTVSKNKGLQFRYNHGDAERVNNIYHYILDNFSREITLAEISKLAHLSPQSFCRYFKSRIKRTFSSFLLEVRIGHACKLLVETNKSIAEVCYESGFNNFSNFNRHFKSIVGKNPRAHRKYYQKIISLHFTEV